MSDIKLSIIYTKYLLILYLFLLICIIIIQESLGTIIKPILIVFLITLSYEWISIVGAAIPSAILYNLSATGRL